MELLDQRTKAIMEGCKERARSAGLLFENETLEYIVTNRDLLELSPKLMIPTLYDYWVHDVEVLQEQGRYELYPNNPYETVINTRPAISFYNDNNPDWLNVMIFYHVLGHIDFFQNNHFFCHTWGMDFNGLALSDKRLIARLRSEKGRWLDYVVEFARGIDNLVDFYGALAAHDSSAARTWSTRLDFYFDRFLQQERKISVHEYQREIERYNEAVQELGELGEQSFFAEINLSHPEFETMFRKHLEHPPERCPDLLSFLCEHSPFLAREDNKWMRSVLQLVRNTSLFFQPQIRTKILNEGWASYWHEKLFLEDDRITGHEVDFARVHAKVTSMPRVGLNPYALGMRLIAHIEEEADRGRYCHAFERLTSTSERQDFDTEACDGRALIFHLRRHLDDFMFINRYVDQDFVNRHQLFVSERRLNESRMVWEYSVKSRKAQDYRTMLLDDLYHPPHITINAEQRADGDLYLTHAFEGKPLFTEYIANTLMGIEYLWGAPIELETHELLPQSEAGGYAPEDAARPEPGFRRVVYKMKNRSLSKQVI